MKRSGFLRAIALAFFTLWLSACGGGGGGDAASAGSRAPLPYLVSDINPSGSRIDVQSRNYFLATTGDRWYYDVFQNGQSTSDQLTRSVTAVVSNGDVAIAETYRESTDTQIRYRQTADGIVIAPLSSTTPQTVLNIVGSLLQYPQPFYAVGAERVVIRQGSWGEDLDGDGVPESFRFEFRQTLTGFETLTVAGLSIGDVAHFRNVVTFKVQPSDLTQDSYTVTTVENAWWGPGIGLMRYDRRVDGSDGEVIVSPYSLMVTGGVVSGETLFAPKPDGVVIKVQLPHNDLVYDKSRGVYYASVPGLVPVNGNRIAVIDATTGSVTFSATAVGSEPTRLSISADGSALFVGLNGAGQVIKLALPELSEQWRIALPVDAFLGQMYAENIAVSPIDSDVLAISLRYFGVSPRHAGVVLYRGTALQTKRTQGHTGSNLIAFDGGGQYVYGVDTESYYYSVRRIAVLVDGLQEDLAVPASGYMPRALDLVNGRLAVGVKVYQTPELALFGTSPSLGGLCVWIGAGQKLVCASNNLNQGPIDAALDVVDANSFVVLASAIYQPGYKQNYLQQIVGGPPGTVAIRIATEVAPQNIDGIWLFKNPTFQ
jgi:hypothetical protein